MQLGQATCVCRGQLSAYTTPKEHIRSIAYETVLLELTGDVSYRKSAKHINRILHREGTSRIRVSTLEEHIERTGMAIGHTINRKAEEVLTCASGFSAAGIPENPEAISPAIRCPIIVDEIGKEDRVAVFTDTIQTYNAGKESCDQILDAKLVNDTEISPDNCVYVSIDDVGVNKQKDTRKNGGSKDGEVIENTVIHIQSKEGEHIITAIGMKTAFKLLIAFLLSNQLLENRHLYIFSDGAKNIRSNIELFFKPLCPFIHMLDWYHLEKRMTELLSMALKGRKVERHNIRNALDRKLWVGNVDDSIKYLRSLDQKFIKNQQKLEEAIAYLDGKRNYMACYALRKELGYRNSSNPAEKTNDLIVADRQKHNGMSWSSDGSGALAVISAIRRNGELDDWIRFGTVPFTMRGNGQAAA